MPSAGRGGAGNIQAVQQENERISADLEASRADAESQTQPAPFREEPQYAHHGRGGAGNWHSPSENGVYKDNNMSQLIGDGVNTLGSGPIDNSSTRSKNLPERVVEPPKFAGRGGSGNYVFGSGDPQDTATGRVTEEEEQKKAQLREQVEQGVKDTLAMPPKAKLPGAQNYP